MVDDWDNIPTDSNRKQDEIVDSDYALELVVKWWESASTEEREKFLSKTDSQKVTYNLWYVYSR